MPNVHARRARSLSTMRSPTSRPTRPVLRGGEAPARRWAATTAAGPLRRTATPSGVRPPPHGARAGTGCHSSSSGTWGNQESPSSGLPCGHDPTGTASLGHQPQRRHGRQKSSRCAGPRRRIRRSAAQGVGSVTSRGTKADGRGRRSPSLVVDQVRDGSCRFDGGGGRFLRCRPGTMRPSARNGRAGSGVARGRSGRSACRAGDREHPPGTDLGEVAAEGVTQLADARYRPVGHTCLAYCSHTGGRPSQPAKITVQKSKGRTSTCVSMRRRLIVRGGGQESSGSSTGGRGRRRSDSGSRYLSPRSRPQCRQTRMQCEPAASIVPSAVPRPSGSPALTRGCTGS